MCMYKSVKNMNMIGKNEQLIKWRTAAILNWNLYLQEPVPTRHLMSMHNLKLF